MAKNEEKQDYDALALEDVAYGTQHALECLLDILITKGVISEQEFKDKLNEMIEQSPDSSQK
jgi:polyhydroxyalkanoate synthesis regulator phasin